MDFLKNTNNILNINNYGKDMHNSIKTTKI